MDINPRIRLSLLALGSSVAALTPVLGAAPASAASSGTTVTESLSAPGVAGVTTDAAGNLTITGAYGGTNTLPKPVTIDVAYSTNGTDGVVVDCDTIDGGPAAPVQVSGDGHNGVASCTYLGVGTYNISARTTGATAVVESAQNSVTFKDSTPPPQTPPPTVNIDLSGGSLDAHGNLTIAEPTAGSPGINVRWLATPAAGPHGSTNYVKSALFTCGRPGDVFGELLNQPLSSAAGMLNCSFSQPGTYTVTLTVTDMLGSKSTVSKTVTVLPAPAVGIDRYDGLSRYGTGVALSQAEYPTAGSAGAVVLARGDAFADALAGIPLAKQKNAPLLLTPGGSKATVLDPHVEAELVRVLPRDKSHTVYVLGGTSAIPQAVEDHLSKVLGYNVVRLSGGDRYATALAVAKDPRALNNPGNVVVARGDDFADALAAGSFAANADKDASGTAAAIVLSDGPANAVSLTPETAAYVSGKLAGSHVAAIGGGAVAAVAALPGSASHFTPMSGQDRYQTAYAVARQGWAVPVAGGGRAFKQTPVIGVASGTSFADALTGGAYMAAQNGPLLLTDGSALSAPVGWVIAQDPVQDVAVFGGTSVLPSGIIDSLIRDTKSVASAYHDHHEIF